MTDPTFSRRKFVRLSGTCLVVPLILPGLDGKTRFSENHFAEKKMNTSVSTVQDVIDLIIQAVPGAPREGSVDTVKTGDPSQPVTGVVTTFLATREVIARTAELNANLLITHEPTFYNHTDDVTWLEQDPVYAAKRALLQEHNIVVFRFHDYWHLLVPDGIQTGVLRRLGWDEYVESEQQTFITLPATSLGELASFLKNRLGSSRVQVVGNADMPVQRVALVPGAAGGRMQIEALRRPDVEVLIVGEINEWETSEYVRDAIDAGMNKGLIILGHVESEEPGMEYLVEWLRPRIPNIPVVHVPSKDPIWNVS